MSGRRRRVVTAGLGAGAAVMCLAAAAMAPGVPQPTPLASYETEGSTTGCASKVLDDWVDDGRVQGMYRLGCYREAIETLPEDMRAYSTAPDDLERAMRTALHRSDRTLAAADP
jgi:hypothetical protein